MWRAVEVGTAGNPWAAVFERRADEEGADVGALFSAYRKAVSAWARHLGSPQAEVDDVVQEVFLVAHRRFRAGGSQRGVAAWLYRVTENVTRHQRRRLRRRRRVFSDGANWENLVAGVALEEYPVHDPAASEVECIDQALDRMGERNRRLIVLFELQGFSGRKIAELTGAKLATVWVWLHRARTELRQVLTQRVDPSDRPEVGQEREPSEVGPER